MEILMTVVPSCIIFFIIAWRAWKTYKGGLFISLVQLGITAVCAVVSFLLTRLLLDPARVDIFGLGQLIIDRIPHIFFEINTDLEAFMSALPTAIMALLAFTFIFETLRFWGGKALYKLEKKHNLSEKFLNFSGNKIAALGVGAVTAAICLLMDLVILNGIVGFSSNMLHCAKTATGQEIFSVMAEALDSYDRSPVKKFTDSLGCKKVFNALTQTSSNGETFSVGQKLTDVSYVLAGIMPVFDALPSEDHMPEPEDLRNLPAQLAATPHSVEMVAGLIAASKDQLAGSDAVLVISRLLGITPQQFAAYLSTITAKNALADLQTICNIAAILREHDLLPKTGDTISLTQLDDESLRAAALAEVLKNPDLAKRLGIAQ